MNAYLLNIFSDRLLKDEINKIIEGKSNITYLNYDDTSIDDIIDECAYFSLMDDEKYIIVKNFKLNASSKPLESYLKSPNPNTTLILVTNSIDKRNAIYKKIKDNGTVIELLELKPNELANKINAYCKNNGIDIDYNSVNRLIEYNLENYDLVLNEIDKLSIIDKNITSDLIDEYASKLNEDDIFGLCDAITTKNMKTINDRLDNFINQKLEVIALVSLLAGQYRIILATKEINDSVDNIAALLDIHPYRVKIAKEKSNLYSKSELEDIIVSLCDLDANLKSLNANPYSLLKEFLIKIL